MSLKNNIDSLLSVVVGLKNNLEYTILFYTSFRAIYPDVELNFVSYGSTDDTHQWLHRLNDKHVNYFVSNDSKSLATTYNKAVEISTKEYFVIMHNDMIATPFFLENILKYLNKTTIVGFSCIEPPIFSKDSRLGKTVMSFGETTEDIRIDELNEYSLLLQKQNANRTEDYIELQFFIALSKEIYIKMGGIDPLFTPMFCEDDDLFLRIELQQLHTITSLDAICYHFVSKTSRFSEDIAKKTKLIENNSKRNFFRKWGFEGYKSQSEVTSVAIILNNASYESISSIEPYCSKLYVDCEFDDYIRDEQPKTKFNLKERIHKIETFVPSNGIEVTINARKFTQEQLKALIKLQQTIKKRELFVTKIIGLQLIANILKCRRTFKIKGLDVKINDLHPLDKKQLIRVN